MNSLVVGKNSFIGLEEADEIIKNTYTSFDTEYKFWTELSDEDKTVLMIRGTRLLNSDRFLWKGQRVDKNQSLVFPRKLNNGRIIEFNSNMKVGLLELIIKLEISKTNDLSVLKSSGITSYSDGAGMSIKFDNSISSKSIDGFNGSGIPLNIFNTYFKLYTMIV